MELKFTDAGRDVVWDLRANQVDPARTRARTDCRPGTGTLGAVPDRLRSEGRASGQYVVQSGMAHGTTTFAVELGLGTSFDGGSSSPWLHKSGYLPSEGWAPDGSCWLVMSRMTVSGAAEEWLSDSGTVKLGDSLSLTLPDGQPAPLHAPEEVGISVYGAATTSLDPIWTQVPADAHTATLTLTPSVSWNQHRVTEQPPAVTSTLTF